ncbi:Catechol 2,3-dioxygenase [Micromonospora phaseoli]|uniref:Catechol 2,3-dioxygenase n=1 Tax=Micromonospora phaseoli TaxID=1144548 RepID=A0A1H7D7V4_9ACTN|nr:glyoxalase [Micromonospora phaseoli]PZV90815.1 catechol 2,3-dioxygenase-like lactoylglutathione lyase family enzyme [Micromonospora phaseoli]GIJ77518.1 glyoxalase [Micromonospora phaseoli]SEJ97384.1 Catechol 2,3-dioxygenase [Micromonospora phaseoli]
MIHHVQLACPRGSEDLSRAFYVGLLGLAELAKPLALAARGGCWFNGYGAELHLGVEDDFRPARKAHPALLRPDLEDLAARLTAAGYPVTWGDDQLPGLRRFHTEDAHGNRLEFVAPTT